MTDDTLIDAFEAAAIPSDRWKHETHVRVAWIMLDRHDFEDALTRMRGGIKRLNAANQVPEAIKRGYHETVTVAWLRIVDAVRRSREPAPTSQAFYDENTQLHSTSVLRLFYTRERIMSAEAKRTFVEPDLTALPHVGQ